MGEWMVGAPEEILTEKSISAQRPEGREESASINWRGWGVRMERIPVRGKRRCKDPRIGIGQSEPAVFWTVWLEQKDQGRGNRGCGQTGDSPGHVGLIGHSQGTIELPSVLFSL